MLWRSRKLKPGDWCVLNDVLVSKNAFYLVCHDSQAELGKIAAFRQWILAKAATEQEKFRFRYEQ